MSFICVRLLSWSQLRVSVAGAFVAVRGVLVASLASVLAPRSIFQEIGALSKRKYNTNAKK